MSRGAAPPVEPVLVLVHSAALPERSKMSALVLHWVMDPPVTSSWSTLPPLTESCSEPLHVSGA